MTTKFAKQLALGTMLSSLLIIGNSHAQTGGGDDLLKMEKNAANVVMPTITYDNQRYSALNQINTGNVGKMQVAWTFSTGVLRGHEGAPLVVGDVMYDTTLFYNEQNAARKTIVTQLELDTKSYVLVTVHRAENTDCDARLMNIVNALIELAQHHQVVFPIHPRTRAAFNRLNLLSSIEKCMRLVEPVGYLDMLALEQHAGMIVTDSGGVQKEAYFNQVPCVTLRNETEWVELVHAGWNQLCSPDVPFTLSFLHAPVTQTKAHEKLYGDGQASEKIVNDLMDYVA